MCYTHMMYDTHALPDNYQRAILVKDDGCWLWQYYLTNGYGRVRLPNSSKHIMAHRATYTLLVGTIPHGMVIDHLCFVKSCVNPSHLEAVTPRENSIRYTSTIVSCPSGHAVTDENTGRRSTTGVRYCRPCNKERMRHAQGYYS